MARRDIPPDLPVVDALCRGVTPPRRPTYVDRLTVIQHLAAAGWTDGDIGARVGRTARQVLRVRTEHGISSGLRQTSRKSPRENSCV